MRPPVKPQGQAQLLGKIHPRYENDPTKIKCGHAGRIHWKARRDGPNETHGVFSSRLDSLKCRLILLGFVRHIGEDSRRLINFTLTLNGRWSPNICISRPGGLDPATQSISTHPRD